MAVEVRPAIPADVDALRAVSRRAWEAAHEPIVGASAVESFLERYYDADSFRERIDDPRRIIAVAASAEPVGFVCASETDDPAVFDLGMLYVTPARWGAGIGGRLLARAEARVRARGGRRVRLGVLADNRRARGFYEAAGYRRGEPFDDERLEARGYSYVKNVERK